MSNSPCCNLCFDHIAKESASAAALWLSLCDVSLQSKVFGLKTQDHKYFRILEMHRYIVTSDTPEVLLVKVLGTKVDDDELIICPAGDHE